MPRNPDKARCVVPGCRNWAMRDHERCRAHRIVPRQAREGSHGAGAPMDNLNALKHGTSAHPLPPSELTSLIAAILADPDDLPLQIGLAVCSIHARTGEPFLTLVALRRLFSQLVPTVAERLFSAELRAMLQPLPPAVRDRRQADIEQRAARTRPEDRLLLLRKTKSHRKQSPEPGSSEL